MHYPYEIFGIASLHQNRTCGFPAAGSCRRSDVIGIPSWAAPAAPIRRRTTPATCEARLGVRSMHCRLPSLRPGAFPPRPPPPFITGLFARFIGTTSPSDPSPAPRQLRLLAFPSRPGIAMATAGQARSPKFRRVRFRSDMVSDPGGATAPRIPVQPVSPSTVLNGSASAMSSFSGLDTYPIRSLCTLRERRHRRPRNNRYRAARYDPTRAGLPPVGPRQLRLRTNTHYQAGATPYLGRTCTGRIPPALAGALNAVALSPTRFFCSGT
jgi:hypothetical protein